MATTDEKLSRQLARLILDAGESGISELKPALERILQGRSGPACQAFLKSFRKEVAHQLRARTLVIESAEPLSDEMCHSVLKEFQKHHNCTLQLTTKVNPSLIGGLKVQLGDDIYDASVANHLQNLAKSL